MEYQAECVHCDQSHSFKTILGAQRFASDHQMDTGHIPTINEVEKV